VDSIETNLLPRLAIAILILPLIAADDPEKSPHGPTASLPYEQFLVIPIRLHVLKAPGLPEIDCALTDADLDRILGKVNGIWHQAGIHWNVDRIVHEPAARLDEFQRRRSDEPPQALSPYRTLVPKESVSVEGMNVYYIHKFPVNGVYLGDAVAFVQETARLRPVPGGIDEPLPRVTAHELGHSLGLPHRQDRTNLLASGNNGTTLSEKEVETARAFARKTRGTRGISEVRKAAEDASARRDRTTARRLWACLAEIPGDGAAAAVRRRDALDAPE
jgi:hypothetical protein